MAGGHGTPGAGEPVTGRAGERRLATQQRNRRLTSKSNHSSAEENGSMAGLLQEKKAHTRATEEPQNACGFGSVETRARYWPQVKGPPCARIKVHRTYIGRRCPDPREPTISKESEKHLKPPP